MWMLPAGTRGLANPAVLVNETSRRGEGIWLARDWRRRVDGIVAAVAATQQGAVKVVGLQIGDELICGGFPLANMTSVTGALRAGLPSSVFIYTNECFKVGKICKASTDCPASGVGPGQCVHGRCEALPIAPCPPGLDYISLDAYEDSVAGDAREAAVARGEADKYLVPGLAPHQKLWAVPGLFGKDARPGTPGANSTLMAATDAALVAKLRGYTAWAAEDEKLAGLLAWHWPNLEPPGRTGFKPHGMVLGGVAYPKLLAEVTSVVDAIPRNR